MRKRYKYRTPHSVKGTYDLGLLYPVQCIEVMGGQTTWLNTKALMRCQPLVAPAFTKMNAHFVHFYVPYRLLWDQWNDFISGANPTLLVPKAKINKRQEAFTVTEASVRGSLFDYFGLPIKFDKDQTAFNISLNMFPFLAYYKIWNEHFRDPDIQKEVDLKDLFDKYQKGYELSDDNSQMSTFDSLFGLKRVNWAKKDRFLQALLQTEANPAITLPVGSDGKAFAFTDKLKGDKPDIRGGAQVNGLIRYWGGAANNAYVNASKGGTIDPSISEGNLTSGMLTTNSALAYGGQGLSGVGLTDFQLAVQAYNFLINANKYGDDAKGYFKKYGLPNLDISLQESQVIGGFADIIQISDIIATSDTNLGKQGGHAVGFAKNRTFKHFAPEWGLIMTMMYIRPDVDYAGGVDRKFMKDDMLDYYQMEFEDVGYQAIFTPEVSCEKLNGLVIPEDSETLPAFGFETRYKEYKSERSYVVGECRPGEINQQYTLCRSWGYTPPNLNSEFLECNPRTDIWASPSTDKIIAYIQHDTKKKIFLKPKNEPKINI